VPRTGANVDFTFVVTNNGAEAVTLTSLHDSVFGELLSGPVALAAHDSYTLTITRWIACDSSVLAPNKLAVSCGCPPTPCQYHYNIVTAVASDSQGNTDTATDDAKVTFTDVKPDISVTKTASVCSVPRTGADVDFTFVVTNNSAEAVTLTSLHDSVFGELLSGPVTIAAHGSYTLTITQWIACDSSAAASNKLAVSCGCPPPPCQYHYNIVTAVAYDSRGNKATATDDAKVIFTDAEPALEDSSIKDGNDSQAAIDSHNDSGDGVVAQSNAAVSVAEKEESTQASEVADIGVSDSRSKPKGLPYLLLALPIMVALAVLGLQIQGRYWTGWLGKSEKDKQK